MRASSNACNTYNAQSIRPPFATVCLSWPLISADSETIFYIGIHVYLAVDKSSFPPIFIDR